MNINHIAKKPFFDLFYRSPCMALLLRAAYHDAGTWDPQTKTGGPRGTLRFRKELSRSENKGLGWAIEQIELIKEEGNHITHLLSYADLIQLGGYAAVEYCGGPTMNFKMGREDVEEEKVAPEGRLPEPYDKEDKITGAIYRLGFSKQEYVAIMGSHTLGFAHKERYGVDSRWTMNPHVFDNTYYHELLLGERSKYLKTKGDTLMLADPEMKKWVEAYADDQNLFFQDYANAHVKMSEVGHTELMSEFDKPKPYNPALQYVIRPRKI